jgi:dephospho-CoA kinase
MFLIGLTGGIASGKSTVAEQWRALGADIIDADELARQAVLPGSDGFNAVLERFGLTILGKDGELDRKALASIIFKNEQDRKELESILHPLIRKMSLNRIESSQSKIVVYVIPLLVETQSELPFDYVVTVEAPEAERVERLIESRGLSTKEAQMRIKAQASSIDRANVSDRILNSNQDLQLFLKDSKLLFTELQKLAQQKELLHGQ